MKLNEYLEKSGKNASIVNSVLVMHSKLNSHGIVFFHLHNDISSLIITDMIERTEKSCEIIYTYSGDDESFCHRIVSKYGIVIHHIDVSEESAIDDFLFANNVDMCISRKNMYDDRNEEPCETCYSPASTEKSYAIYRPLFFWSVSDMKKYCDIFNVFCK